MSCLQDKKPFIILDILIDSEAFSGIVWIHLLHASFPSCGRILKLVCLLCILGCTVSAADSVSFVFLKVVLQLRFAVSSLPTDSWPVSCVCFLSTRAFSWDLAQGASSRVGGGVGLCIVSCRCSWVRWGVYK